MTPLTSTQQARVIFDAALADFCRDFNQQRVTPILEADIAGYLYHRIIANGCPLNMAYLATRLCGEAARSRKLDLVIGTLNSGQACIVPLLVCELKVFQRWGHSDQQMNQRFTGLLGENLPSLQEASNVLPSGRIALVADLCVSRQRRGFLAGTWGGKGRRELIAEKCKEIGATFIWVHPQTDCDDVVCEVMVEPDDTRTAA